MIRLPADITPNDAQQWLEGGVFFARPPGSPDFKLATLAGVLSAELLRVNWIAVAGRSEVATVDVRAHWPTCGAINLPQGFAVDVQRLQRKQYRRTYNSRCVRISVPGKWYCLKRLSGEDMAPDQHSAAFLKALFYPEYPESVEAGLAKLHSNEAVSVAINPHIILISGARTRVYYRGEYVGRYDGETFLTEVDDALAAHVRKSLNGG